MQAANMMLRVLVGCNSQLGCSCSRAISPGHVKPVIKRLGEEVSKEQDYGPELPFASRNACITKRIHYVCDLGCKADSHKWPINTIQKSLDWRASKAKNQKPDTSYEENQRAEREKKLFHFRESSLTILRLRS